MNFFTIFAMSHFSRFRCALRPLAWAAAVTCIATPAGGGAATAAVLPDVTARATQDGRLPRPARPSASASAWSNCRAAPTLSSRSKRPAWPPCAMRWITSPASCCKTFSGATDQPRLSIRGSGIQSNPVNRGVVLLQDGLPLNEADGSFVIGTLEPRNAALGQRPPGGEHPHAQRHHPGRGAGSSIAHRCG